jgi:hypothetical protein
LMEIKENFSPCMLSMDRIVNLTASENVSNASS